MDPQPLHAELKLAIELASQAARVIMQYFKQPIKTDTKKDKSPITQADRDANEIIVSSLAKHFPNDAILAEESELDPNRHKARRLWCIDPLDGTKEFIKHKEDFVVMIGLAIDGEARLGVVMHPPSETIYWGTAERAMRQEPAQNATPMHINDCSEGKHASMAVSRSHFSQSMEEIASFLGTQSLKRIGSVGLKAAEVASGEASIYASLTHYTQEWDACAPEAIVRAAGGRVSDCMGEPLRYNKSEPNTPNGMLFSNGLMHEKTLQAIANLHA